MGKCQTFMTHGSRRISGHPRNRMCAETRSLTRVKRMLWKTLAVQETKKEVFTLREARELFDRMLARRPIEEQMEDTCALSVERENGGYLIKLILMDKNRNFVRMTTKSYYGYVLTAKHIDEMLGRYMNGQTVRILPNPNR